MHSMIKRKNILAINGSASKNSSNLSILNFIKASTEDEFHFTILTQLENNSHKILSDTMYLYSKRLIVRGEKYL